jgi:hypothetical protein
VSAYVGEAFLGVWYQRATGTKVHWFAKKCRLRKNGYWYFTILVTVLPHASDSKVRWS